MCYPDGEFIVGDRDVLLGIVEDTPVWISGPQFDAWKHTQLVIDAVPGRGGGFSMEAPEGMRFLSRGRAFTPDGAVGARRPAAASGRRLRRWQAAPAAGGPWWSPRPPTFVRCQAVPAHAPYRAPLAGSRWLWITW